LESAVSATERKVFAELKHGYGLICPKCGGSTFVLETNITIIDYAEFNEESGTLTVFCESEEEITEKFKDMSIDDVDKILCEKCGTKVPKKMLLEIPPDKMKFY